MSQHLRYLVTVDSTGGAPAKVEQVGAAGDLLEVDLASFTRLLETGSRGVDMSAQRVSDVSAGEGAAWAQGGGAAVNPLHYLGGMGITPAPSPPPAGSLNKQAEHRL